MNRHDSERITGVLQAEGLTRARSGDGADVIVYNTCCVRQHAEERLYGRLSQLVPLKRANPGLLIAVTGCVAQKDADSVFARAPHVDLVVGTHATAEIGRLVRAQLDGEHARTCVLDSSTRSATDLPAVRESPVHGWLTIMTGCDNFCSYCIVPHVRGRERSRPLEEVVREAEAMAADGVLDITLLGQNVNSFGRDLYGRPRFAELLKTLDMLGVPRIRFATSHPKDLCDETINAIAASTNVCRHIHLPVQSGSTTVLSRMNRGYTKADYLALVGRIRDAMPDASLSTDIIVGFPGETEADFSDTLDVVAQSGFDQAFTFIYSRRSGTPAASMNEQVEENPKQERFRRLLRAVTEQARLANEAYLGRTLDVLVEGPSAKHAAKLAGRTSTNKIVHFDGPEALRHRMVTVTITAARTWFLEARLVDASGLRQAATP